jgi:protein-S-isoprenylcysteine O-methyltransferase Ste14
MIAEIVFGLPFLLGVLIQFVFPDILPRDALRTWGVVVGMAPIVIGVTIARAARRELREAMQPTEPGQPTTRIVTTGVFSHSRNPLYLATVLILAGVALALALPWALLAVVPGMVACRYLLIGSEERYLAAKFPEEYRQYSAAVRRWIGRASRGLRDDH